MRARKCGHEETSTETLTARTPTSATLEPPARPRLQGHQVRISSSQRHTGAWWLQQAAASFPRARVTRLTVWRLHHLDGGHSDSEFVSISPTNS